MIETHSEFLSGRESAAAQLEREAREYETQFSSGRGRDTAAVLMMAARLIRENIGAHI